jgi:hypothetical protein
MASLSANDGAIHDRRVVRRPDGHRCVGPLRRARACEVVDALDVRCEPVARGGSAAACCVCAATAQRPQGAPAVAGRQVGGGRQMDAATTKGWCGITTWARPPGSLERVVALDTTINNEWVSSTGCHQQRCYVSPVSGPPPSAPQLCTQLELGNCEKEKVIVKKTSNQARLNQA